LPHIAIQEGLNGKVVEWMEWMEKVTDEQDRGRIKSQLSGRSARQEARNENPAQ